MNKKMILGTSYFVLFEGTSVVLCDFPYASQLVFLDVLHENRIDSRQNEASNIISR